LLSNPERAESSIDGTTEEKVSFINNALRHVILGGNYSKKSFNLRLDILGGAEELRLS
jgi:hypothetical protein